MFRLPFTTSEHLGQINFILRAHQMWIYCKGFDVYFHEHEIPRFWRYIFCIGKQRYAWRLRVGLLLRTKRKVLQILWDFMSFMWLLNQFSRDTEWLSATSGGKKMNRVGKTVQKYINMYALLVKDAVIVFFFSFNNSLKLITSKWCPWRPHMTMNQMVLSQPHALNKHAYNILYNFCKTISFLTTRCNWNHSVLAQVENFEFHIF